MYISTNIIKESEKNNIVQLIMGVHKASIELDKSKIIRARKVLIESELYSNNKPNYIEVEPIKHIYTYNY